MERETGIEPATNSLEGCDSTTELLPPSSAFAPLRGASARQAVRSVQQSLPSHLPRISRGVPSRLACLAEARSAFSMRAKDGGEGRTRTFEGAWPTDLQSAAF